MMNDLVQWRQVPLPETKVETPPPPEKSQQHKKNSPLI